MFEERVRKAASRGEFVVAMPARFSATDARARVLEQIDRLRFIALGTRRGAAGVSAERTRLNPWIGLFAYLGAKTLSPFKAESFSARLFPLFDRWVVKQLHFGDRIISSYGYANECFKFVRRHGGKTFLEAGNSHIENFWETITEEHQQWNCPYPPIALHWYERARAMLADTDYVFSPSSYVTGSFLTRGFKPEQILETVYPINLSLFQPSAQPRPKSRPLTIINTGSLSLRKGTPYLLEGFSLIRQKYSSARLLLTRVIQDDVKPVLQKYSDLPIEWSPSLSHAELAERLRSADIFVLPSLEEGLARTALEALACGLPAIVTPNSGVNDIITSGTNGEVVPIRDPQAIADAILKWSDRVYSSEPRRNMLPDPEKFSFENFKRCFLRQLYDKGLVSEGR